MVNRSWQTHVHAWCVLSCYSAHRRSTVSLLRRNFVLRLVSVIMLSIRCSCLWINTHRQWHSACLSQKDLFDVAGLPGSRALVINMARRLPCTQTGQVPNYDVRSNCDLLEYTRVLGSLHAKCDHEMVTSYQFSVGEAASSKGSWTDVWLLLLFDLGVCVKSSVVQSSMSL